MTASGPRGTYLSSAELYHPDTGTWTPTGGIFYERLGHTATLLPNGKVLVAGGTENTNTELYNPATGDWNATGRLNAARPSGHAATLLSDGRVLVVGGYDQLIPYADCFLSSAEIYDENTQVWTPTGSLNSGRYGLTATLLADGKVLALGGGDGSVELYDPATGAWTLTGSTFYVRFGHTATRLQDGKVLVAGGLTYTPVPRPHDDSLNSAELYDPAAGNWYSVGKLNVARRYHTATLLPNGQVLAVGGVAHDLYSGGFLKLTSTELYDPTTLVWTSAGNLQTGRSGHTETTLHTRRLEEGPFFGFKVLVAGGDDALSYSDSLSSAELYSSGGEPPVATTGTAASLRKGA
jgi:large repetitive protein